MSEKNSEYCKDVKVEEHVPKMCGSQKQILFGKSRTYRNISLKL